MEIEFTKRFLMFLGGIVGAVVVFIVVAVLIFWIGTAAIVAGVFSTPENRLSRHMRAAERYLPEMNYERAAQHKDDLLKIWDTQEYKKLPPLK